MILKFATY